MDPERAFRMSRREDPEEAPEDEDTGCGDWPEAEEEDLPEEEDPDIRRVTRDMDALLERLRNTALEEDE